MSTTLVHGPTYVKHEGRLPSGFGKAAAEEDIAVHGRAVGDEHLLAGGDSIRYKIDVGHAQGAFATTLELLCQSVGYRWARNLRQHEATEMTCFPGYYETVPDLPVVIASGTVGVGH